MLARTAGAAALLQREAALAAQLFDAAGRRPPGGIRQAAASSSSNIARFSVPVSRMGDYLEVRRCSLDVGSCSTVPHFPRLPYPCLMVLRARLDKWWMDRQPRGMRRCGTLRWTMTSAQSSAATHLATPSCEISAPRPARSPVRPLPAVSVALFSQLQMQDWLLVLTAVHLIRTPSCERSGRGGGRGAGAGPGLCGRRARSAAAAHARPRCAQPRARCCDRLCSRDARQRCCPRARAHPCSSGAPCVFVPLFCMLEVFADLMEAAGHPNTACFPTDVCLCA